MENPLKVKMSFNIPKVHGVKQFHKVLSNVKLPIEDEMKIEIQENNEEMSLAVVKCTMETKDKLDDVITHYVETLNKYKSKFLGMLLMCLLHSMFVFLFFIIVLKYRAFM